MKIIVAQSFVGGGPTLGGYVEALCEVLSSAEHDVQRLDLPATASADDALPTVASYRLLSTTEWADAIICLDTLVAVLPHSRKIVWLLEDVLLSQADKGGADPTPECEYLANVVRAALDEAEMRFAPSRLAMKKMKAMGLKKVELLQPAISLKEKPYPRRSGPELLILGTLSGDQRPELLVDCLKALPGSARARWVAPSAEPAVLDSFRRRADLFGVGARIALDVRAISTDETAYLLAHAAALIELAPGSWVIPQHAQAAVEIGLPVIACKDGGAVTEIRTRRKLLYLAEPSGRSLAKAVQGACGGRTKGLPSPQTGALTGAEGWTPLLRALSK